MLHGRQLFKMNLRPAEENTLLHIKLIHHWPILIMIETKHTHAMSFKYSNSKQTTHSQTSPKMCRKIPVHLDLALNVISDVVPLSLVFPFIV